MEKDLQVVGFRIGNETFGVRIASVREIVRVPEITQEINSAVEEQASGAQAVVRAMDKMRELVQQSASSSTELSAAAEQMLKLSRNLLDSMDRFVLDQHVPQEGGPRREAAEKRRKRESNREREMEYAEARQ